jgi:DNA-binding NarL/FixJ family response regulator
MHEAPRVLIVEDQFFVALDCEQHLREAGFECIGFATTGTGALELAEREHPDLIIMDIRLADAIDGVQAAIRIYEQFGIRSIFSSGHADTLLRSEAARAHPFAWLDKPYTGDALIRAARKAMEELARSRLIRSEEKNAPSPSMH